MIELMRRITIRRMWIADGIAALVINLPLLRGGLADFVAVFAFSLGALWLLRRLGFLAFLVYWVFQLMLNGEIFMTTGWIAGPSIAFLMLPLAIAVWALWVILSAQKPLSTESAA